MRSLLIMLMACLLFGCPLARAQLSDEARADMYLVQAKEALEKEDYAGAVRMLGRIERLNLSMPNEFHYFYGKSLYKINANDKARQQLERYVNAVGRSGRYYNQTLSMLHDLEEKQQQQLAEQRRREQQAAEEQRRREQKLAEEKEKAEAIKRKIDSIDTVIKYLKVFNKENISFSSPTLCVIRISGTECERFNMKQYYSIDLDLTKKSFFFTSDQKNH